MGNTKLSGLFLLWLGASISIAEIVTGTLVAPLGWIYGPIAIITGHLIGCILFLLPAGYISAQRHQTAIQATEMSFGKLGVGLFSILNALQLLGWTAVMIVNAQLAMNAINQRLFNFKSPILMSSIVAILIIIWLLLKHDWLFRVNNFIVILLAIGSIILLFTVITSGQIAPHANLVAISFGGAVELSVTMALSWLPLIGDYTTTTSKPFLTSLASVAGYFIGSCVMFLIGMASVLITKSTDFTTVLSHSNLGLIALLIIVFSTVTTTFMDAYSAATNINNLTHFGKVGIWGSAITVLGLVIALTVSLSYYQNFLYAIGAVFTPLFTIVFVSYFVLKGSLPAWINFCWWIIGVISYHWMQTLNLWSGPTLALLLCLGACVSLNGFLMKNKLRR